jgi:NAD(P)-dependent dehydrogenase (short-subunit alcohol dehydrogenase family)
MRRLERKVALITGGAGGLGSACARRLVDEGASVVVADILEQPAKDLAAKLGNGSIGLHFDCGDPASIEAGIEETVRQFGKIDILLNNAAATAYEILAQDRTAVDTPIEIWDLTMNINVRGMMLGCKYAIPHMIRNGGGSIINMSSGAAVAGDNIRIAYGTSKAAVVGLTKYVAAQHGRQNIRCNAIMPGAIYNDILAQYPELVARAKRQAMTPRIGKPSDIAAMVAFLAADESEYITGQAYAVDGGHLAHQPQMADMRAIEAPELPPLD